MIGQDLDSSGRFPSCCFQQLLLEMERMRLLRLFLSDTYQPPSHRPCSCRGTVSHWCERTQQLHYRPQDLPQDSPGRGSLQHTWSERTLPFLWSEPVICRSRHLHQFCLYLVFRDRNVYILNVPTVSFYCLQANLRQKQKQVQFKRKEIETSSVGLFPFTSHDKGWP